MVSFKILLATFGLIILSANADNPYCNVPNRKCSSNHTMCLYPHNEVAAVCGDCIATKLTEKEKNAIIKYHNDMRQKVTRGEENRGNPGPQHRAVNMSILTWNDELATIAQRWANQCTHDHDKCRTTKLGMSIGQNIAAGSTTGNKPHSVLDLVALWYNEVKLFNKEDIHSFKFDKETGHYTQFVWAETKEIGCGVVKCKKNESDAVWTEVSVICNYAPAGNVIGARVYFSGGTVKSFSFSALLIVFVPLIYSNYIYN